ncbi:Cordon-bleu protein-like 1 [Camelus dromedarius]|uniref:Cordon-bleu protein-like 1 n=1 Tax=Camelus dromedarius TaxID=9838 RepID=A0A5N4E698_CAMDR|nr:Cordon-bleu protein-like 1 [Camelus dromedarius]
MQEQQYWESAGQSVPAVPTDSVLEASLPEGLSSPAGMNSDYSLEEIDEKEELSEVPKDETEHTSVKSPDVPTGSTDIISPLKNDPDSALGSDTGESSQNSKEEKQETRNTDGHIWQKKMIISAHLSLEIIACFLIMYVYVRLNIDQDEITVIPTNTEDNMKNGVRTEINVRGVAKNNNVDMEVNRLPNYQAHKTDTARSYKEDHLAVSSIPDQKLNQPSAEKTKVQDAAIQTVPSCDSFSGNHQDHNSSDIKVDESVQTSSNNKSTQHSSLSPQDSVDTSREFKCQGPLIVHSEDQLAIKDPVYAHGNDDLLPPVDGTDKNSAASYIKNYPLYRQDYNPKPKPSNEITREYIPKIGMTTYKIVPPRSLEISKDWESETIGYKNDQEIHALGKKDTHENVKETAIQTEDLVISESPKEPQADLKPKPTLKTEHQVQSVESMPLSMMANPLKPTSRMMRDTGTAPFVPNLEDINNILESKRKSRVSNPQAKPSSFFLQMQKRVSGHYVTSAAAKSVQPVPNPTPKELTKKEVERDTIPPPEPALSPLIAPKPVPLPGSQSAALNLKALKTFCTPRPYSGSAPSPFALAVVKRSQSFSKARKESCSEEAWGAHSQTPSDSEEGKIPSVHTLVDVPQLGVSDKENNSTHNEQNPQIPSPTDCPSFTLKRQSSSTFQSSDPEQIRQSLLTAIRSGEAAAKLKRKSCAIVGVCKFSVIAPSDPSYDLILVAISSTPETRNVLIISLTP